MKKQRNLLIINVSHTLEQSEVVLQVLEHHHSRRSFALFRNVILVDYFLELVHPAVTSDAKANGEAAVHQRSDDTDSMWAQRSCRVELILCINRT